MFALGLLALLIGFADPSEWGALIVVGLGLLGIAVPAIRQDNNYNRTAWPAEMAAWEHKFICLRCGQVFDVAL